MPIDTRDLREAEELLAAPNAQLWLESGRLRGDAERLRLQAEQIRSDVVEIRLSLEDAKARRAIAVRTARSGSAETRRSFAASPDVEPEPIRDALSTDTEV